MNSDRFRRFVQCVDERSSGRVVLPAGGGRPCGIDDNDQPVVFERRDRLAEDTDRFVAAIFPYPPEIAVAAHAVVDFLGRGLRPPPGRNYLSTLCLAAIQDELSDAPIVAQGHGHAAAASFL